MRTAQKMLDIAEAVIKLDFRLKLYGLKNFYKF